MTIVVVLNKSKCLANNVFDAYRSAEDKKTLSCGTNSCTVHNWFELIRIDNNWAGVYLGHVFHYTSFVYTNLLF